MTNITFSVDEETHVRMKAHPEIKWSEILRQAIKKYLKKIEKTRKISVEDLRKRLDKETLDVIDNLDPKEEIENYKKLKDLESRRAAKLEELIRGTKD